MTRSIPCLALVGLLVLFGAPVEGEDCVHVQDREQPTTALVGRLATVEPASRRVTFVPEGEVRRVEVFVAERGTVIHDDSELTLADLVIQVGRRVTVLSRLQDNRRIADRIIVEPE